MQRIKPSQMDYDPPTGTVLTGVALDSTQTTSSYRSGKSADMLSDDDVDALLSTRSWGGTFAHLADEYQKAPQSAFDTGHTFDTTIKRLVCTPVFHEEWDSPFGSRYRYDGPLFANHAYYSPTWQNLPTTDPSYWGPKAVGIAIPTKPSVNLAVGISELAREGFPKMGLAFFNYLQRGKLLRDAGKTASEEYLAWEFGLRPILRDFTAAYSSILSFTKSWAQLVQDSGKLVRRRINFPVTTESWDFPAEPGRLSFISNSISSEFDRMFVGQSKSGTQLRSVTRSQRVWFSGAFTYYLPTGVTLWEDIKLMERRYQDLLGFEFSPEALWNLTPWSWLSDWTNNIGQNIANATSFGSDNLVMKYGYLMSTTTADHAISLSGPTIKRTGFQGPYTTIFRVTRKQRWKATPYGFGLNPSAFSPRQWAILAALGFTKGDRVLP